MAYSLLKGVRLGFLPESYREYGLKAFHGICDRYLKEKDGSPPLPNGMVVAHSVQQIHRLIPPAGCRSLHSDLPVDAEISG